MKKHAILLLLIWTGIHLSAQTRHSPDTLLARMQQQANLFPYEKLHLHTDKSVYMPGKPIWFRAFPVDGLTNQPVYASRYVYTELIDSAETVVSRMRFRMEADSLYAGRIPLDATLPGGQYVIRAYTRYMENSGKEYFFCKPIRILPLSEKVPEKKQPGYTNQKSVDFHVDFLPEGGQWLDGTPCRIAFKALNSKGLGEDISGWIVDEKKDTLLAFGSTHRGMGVFTLRGKKGKRYRAHCQNAEGMSETFEMPAVTSESYALKVEESRGQIFVSVLYPEGVATKDSLLIFALQRGKPLYAQWIQGGKTEHLSFDKQLFQTGTVHWLLLHANNQAISERLIFVRNDDQASLSAKSDRPDYAFREKVQLTFNLKDSKGNPAVGNFSLAVTDDRSVPVDSTQTILSSLLLTSDLKGYVENPAWYFQTGGRKTQHALDVLMLTQGWRRYNITEVLQGSYSYPTTSPETSMKLSGSVKTLIRRKPVEKASVRIWSPEARMIETVTTGNDGLFSLEGFEFPDTTNYQVYTVSEKGKENMLLEVDSTNYPSTTDAFIPEIPFTNPADNQQLTGYKNQTLRRLDTEEGIRTILLDEVTISARKKKEYKTPYQHAINGKSITSEEIRKSPTQDLFTLLQSQFPGIDPLSDECYLLLNDVPIEDSTSREATLRTYPLSDIEQIDVLRGAETIGFDPSGKHGLLIAITFKKGFNLAYEYTQQNRTNTRLLGYQHPEQFYAPVYETEKQKNNIELDLRTTLYWCPKVNTDSEGKAIVEFYTSDSGASFSVVAEGVLDNGELFRLTQPF